MEVTPGDIVSFELYYREPTNKLERMPSTYGYANLELAPVPMDLYVVCKDGSMARWQNPGDPIGWELIIKDDVPYYRTSQFGFEPVEVRMRFMDKAPEDMIYAKNNPVGGRVEFCKPAEAEITEQKDDDLEVVSKFNPHLGEAAEYLNDPVQTAALARFAEGKMSYAEMRGLCG
jgi:hypothetical protein